MHAAITPTVLLAREGGDEFDVARSQSPCAPVPQEAEPAMKAIAGFRIDSHLRKRTRN
jgi:hypothetical protein